MLECGLRRGEMLRESRETSGMWADRRCGGMNCVISERTLRVDLSYGLVWEMHRNTG